ncbi:MAG: sodium:solute symporter family protein, partial [Deltaproteobacteria bacterium]|nr:sodium:solute symporter family protein [Deltaproteobacteria bacterium]
MSVPLLIVIIYIVVLYAVSWYSTKLTGKGGAIGFFLANRGFPAIVVAVMIAGQAIGGASTVGVAQNSYTQGLSAGMYNAAWAIGAIILGLLCADRYRNLQIATIPDLFERFYSSSGRLLGVIGQLIILLTIVALQYVAGGAVLTALMPQYFNFNSGMIITAIVFVGICLIGGYWAAGLSNLINVIVIYIGLVIGAVMVVNSAGGLSTMQENLVDPHWFSWVDGVGMVGVVSWFAVMITQAFGAQGPAQVTFAAKDGKTARNGFLIGGLLILPVGFVSALFGMAAATKYPGLENSAMALPTILMEQPSIISGLTLAGLWAADVSTAVGLLLGAATMLMVNVIKPMMKPNWTHSQELKYSRLLVLLVAIVTFIMALQVRSILGTIMIGLSLTTAYTIILLATLF